MLTSSSQTIHAIAKSEKYILDSAAEYGNKASNLESDLSESGVYEGNSYRVTCFFFFFNNYDHVCLCLCFFVWFLTLYKPSIHVDVSWYLQRKEWCLEVAKKYADMRHVSLDQVFVFFLFHFFLTFFAYTEKSLTELFDFHHWSSWLTWIFSERERLKQMRKKLSPPRKPLCCFF